MGMEGPSSSGAAPGQVRGPLPAATMARSMLRLRLLLAWLLMAALPLQGFAAASMLFCGVERGAVSQAAGDGHASHQHGDAPTSAHDHAAHGHGSQDHHAKADTGSGSAPQADQDPQGHGCPVCASCCQVVGIGGFEPFPQTSAPPGVEPSSPVVRVATRTTTVPDKPPRA
jgi:hypothetical protein